MTDSRYIATDVKVYRIDFEMFTLDGKSHVIPWDQVLVGVDHRRCPSLIDKGEAILFPDLRSYRVKYLVDLAEALQNPKENEFPDGSLETVVKSWLALPPSDRRILAQLAQKMANGSKLHGALDLKKDKRKWLAELRDELLDGIHYLNFYEESEAGR